MNNSITPILAQ